MARSLRLKVIAEGVETEAQMSILRFHQCGEIQGYYFSKPISADEASSMLQREDRLDVTCDEDGAGKLYWPVAHNYSVRPLEV